MENPHPQPIYTSSLTSPVEVPDALLTEDGLNLQVGAAVVAAAPFSIMLPQESVTL